MNLSECKVNMRIREKASGDEGVISSIEFNEVRACTAIWVNWKTGRDKGCRLWTAPEKIEKITYKKKFTIPEIFALLDEIEANCNNTSRDLRYATELEFTELGLRRVREYLEDLDLEKIQEKIKAVAISKLTSEEIAALGIKV